MFYDYNPFGEILQENGADSRINPFRFSTKYTDTETNLIYYGYRYYNPQTGKWISRDPIEEAGGVNLYGFVGNNPINKNDGLGLYEIDVHYYLTYFLASKNSCFTEAEARLIADADQGTDEHPDTLPGPGLTAKQRYQNSYYHNLQENQNLAGVGSATLWQEAMNGPTNYVGLGRYLHFLQDTFSHEGFTNSTWGHSPLSWLGVPGHNKGGTHITDKTSYDVPKAMRMAGATWIALNNYAKEKKCGCQGKFDLSWWKQITDFAQNGLPPLRMHLESIDETGPYLERKISPLNVPLR